MAESVLRLSSQMDGFIIPFFMEIIKMNTRTFYYSMILLVLLYLGLLLPITTTKEAK